MLQFGYARMSMRWTAFAFLKQPVSAEALAERLQAFLRQSQKEEARLEFCKSFRIRTGIYENRLEEWRGGFMEKKNAIS